MTRNHHTGLGFTARAAGTPWGVSREYWKAREDGLDQELMKQSQSMSQRAGMLRGDDRP
jgi:hypothetical protein